MTLEQHTKEFNGGVGRVSHMLTIAILFTLSLKARLTSARAFENGIKSETRSLRTFTPKLLTTLLSSAAVDAMLEP